MYATDHHVLNLFCYTGGFSCYAMRGNALSVHSVDSSAKAIALTNKNIALNFPDNTRHHAFTEDAFKYLKRMQHPYDLIHQPSPSTGTLQEMHCKAINLMQLRLKRYDQRGGIYLLFPVLRSLQRTIFV